MRCADAQRAGTCGQGDTGHGERQSCRAKVQLRRSRVQKCKGGGNRFGWRVAASGGRWRARVFTPRGTGDRIVGWGGARFSEPAVGHY